MERPPLPSLERSAYFVPMTPVRRRLAEEILRISLTEVPQDATREARPTSSSASSDQPGDQGPGLLADQTGLQDERDAHLQVAVQNLRPISIVPHNSESAGVGQDRSQSFANAASDALEDFDQCVADAARDALEDLNRGNAPPTQSSTEMQDLLGTTFSPRRDPRDQLNVQMWMRFRLELLRLEIGLATDFSNPVKVWLCEIIRGRRDRQSPRKQES